MRKKIKITQQEFESLFQNFNSILDLQYEKINPLFFTTDFADIALKESQKVLVNGNFVRLCEIFEYFWNLYSNWRCKNHDYYLSTFLKNLWDIENNYDLDEKLENTIDAALKFNRKYYHDSFGRVFLYELCKNYWNKLAYELIQRGIIEKEKKEWVYESILEILNFYGEMDMLQITIFISHFFHPIELIMKSEFFDLNSRARKFLKGKSITSEREEIYIEIYNECLKEKEKSGKENVSHATRIVLKRHKINVDLKLDSYRESFSRYRLKLEKNISTK